MNKFCRNCLVFLCLFLATSKAYSQFVTIPDANFVTWLKTHGYSGCFTASNQMDTTCSAITNATSVLCYHANISDLTGIRYFDKLITLKCDTNNLTALPTLPPLLNTLQCSFNNITSLNFSSASLRNFTCNNNAITTVVSLPAGLQTFYCQQNQITSIQSLPSTLINLDCSYNVLTSLPTLPSALINLYCYSNQLSSLPSLPNGLTTLYCFFNQLTNLPPIPASLSYMAIHYNNLTSLPVLPASLYSLQCNNNQLTSLPVLGVTLQNLYTNNNFLTSLPVLPNSLKNLSVGYNQLTSLPVLPPTLYTLNCDSLSITSIPVLPNTLKYLYCRGTQLTSLPALNDTMTALYMENNPGITCLPSISKLDYFYWGNTGLACLTKALSVTTAQPSIANLSICNSMVITGSHLFCSPNPTALSVPGGSNFVWRLNNVIINGATSKTYMASSAGSYTCQVTTSCGAYVTPAFIVNAATAPPAVITASGPLQFCTPDSVILTANSGAGLTYIWFLGTNAVTTNNPYVVKSIIGTFPVTVLVTNSSGCSSMSSAVTVTTPSPYLPVITGTSSFCPGGYVNLYTAYGHTGQWYLNGNAIAGAINYYYTATAGGTYTFTSISCDTFTSPPFVVTAFTAPPASITASGPLTFCSGDSVILTANSGPPYHYNWLYYGSQQSAVTKSYTVKLAGSWSVRVTDTTTGCFSVSAALVTSVPAKITPIISGPSMVCSGGTVLLTATGGTSFQWYKNNVIIPGATSSTYSAGTAGSYTCTSISCDTITSLPFVLNVITAPLVSINTTSTTLCPNASATLSATPSVGFIYQWYKNNVIITGATANIYTATSAGNYTVVVTHSLNCFSPVTSNNIAISNAIPPVATITAPSPGIICSGSNLLLSANTSVGYSYKWYWGNTEIVGQNASTYNAITSGSYYVKITDALGCFDTSEVIPVVLGIPTATITNNYPAPYCAGDYNFLTANTSGLVNSFLWKLNGTAIPNGIYSTLSNLSPYTTNNYTVDVSNQCGTYTSAPLVITMLPKPTSIITTSGPTGFCAPGSVTLYANTASSYKYQWYLDYGNGTIAGATQPSYMVTQSGTYYLTIIDSTTGCRSQSNGVVVNNTGTNLFLYPNAYSYGACSSFVLTASPIPAGYVYKWYRENVVIPGATAQTYTATTPTAGYQGISYDKYFVQAVGPCGTTTSNTVNLDIDTSTLIPSSVIIYPYALSACNGDSIFIGINRWVTDYYLEAVAIQWKLNGIAIPGATGNYYYAKTPGNYSIDVTVPCGTTSSNVATLTFIPSPNAVITANGSTFLCNGSNVILKAISGNGYLFQWKNNNQIIAGAIDSFYAATTAGTYTCIVSLANSCARISNYINVYNGSINNNFTISGSTGFCRPSTGNIYNAVPAQNNSLYKWTVPTGATITNGQGTSAITISFASNAAAGNICVSDSNACGVSALKCQSIALRTGLPTIPGTITGSTNGCPGDVKVYSIRKIATADYYLWTPPIGATINGSSTALTTPDTIVTVSFSQSFTGDTIRVRSINCKGMSSERKLRINKNIPSAPGPVTGNSTGCCNSFLTYSTAAVTNANTYTWRTNIPGSGIYNSVNGNFGITLPVITTTSSSVSIKYSSFISGQVYVKANNGCGSSAERSLTVYARPAVPSSITGPSVVCDGDSNVAFTSSPVVNTNYYNWTTLTGSSITNGQGTISAKLKFGNVAASGVVRVRSQNSCASSAYLSKSVTVNLCPRMMQESINSELLIYPNPFSESATIVIPDETTLDNSHIIIYDVFGKEVRTISNLASHSILIEKENLSQGIYILMLNEKDKTSISVKLTIQ